MLDDYAARGVFRVAAQPNRQAVEIFRLHWFRDQAMTLELSLRRPSVRLINVVPPITPRSTLDRQLRAWLAHRQSAGLPEHRRIDPAEFVLKLRRCAGQVTLELRCGPTNFIAATETLIRLVNELYLDFLAAAERFDWVQEVFELDPDNPRWP